MDKSEMKSQLEQQLAELTNEIRAAQAKDEMYSGGLIKSLVGMRIEILLISKALIEQRISALDSGAEITLELPGSKPDEEQANVILKEIESVKEQLEVARRDAARYSGGLIHSMKLSAVATQEQTLAMLSQQYAMAKFGLALPTMSNADNSSNDDQQAQDSTPEPRQTPRFEIKGIDARVTESNRSWSKFAWKLTIENLSQETIRVDAIVEFQDEDGFVVDDDRARGLIVKPLREETFTGYALVDANSAGQVSRINAKAQLT